MSRTYALAFCPSTSKPLNTLVPHGGSVRNPTWKVRCNPEGCKDTGRKGKLCDARMKEKRAPASGTWSHGWCRRAMVKGSGPCAGTRRNPWGATLGGEKHEAHLQTDKATG